MYGMYNYKRLVSLGNRGAIIYWGNMLERLSYAYWINWWFKSKELLWSDSAESNILKMCL